MGLDGECPVCGTKGPLEIFLLVLESKRCLQLVAELPREVAPLALYYLSLFRPDSGRGVSLKKAERLLGELSDEIKKGYVQYDRKVARNATPRIWADAIQTMLDNRPGLKLPLPNHRYLTKVAWDKADEADSSKEAATRSAEQCHLRPRSLSGAEGAGAVKSVPAKWAITD